MERELVKKFNKNFYGLLIIISLTLLLMLTIAVVLWIYTLWDETSVIALLFTSFILIYILISSKKLMPFFKDYKLVKQRMFEKCEGEVVKYHKIILGGEPETIMYRPIIKDILTGNEIELDVKLTEASGIYVFLYLSNTKLAVFESVDI